MVARHQTHHCNHHIIIRRANRESTPINSKGSGDNKTTENRGRTSKNNAIGSEKSSEISNSEISKASTRHIQGLIVRSKEQIQHSNGNADIFVGSDEIPRDEGAKELMAFKRISAAAELEIGEIRESKMGIKHRLFSLCIGGDGSDFINGLHELY